MGRPDLAAIFWFNFWCKLCSSLAASAFSSLMVSVVEEEEEEEEQSLASPLLFARCEISHRVSQPCAQVCVCCAVCARAGV